MPENSSNFMLDIGGHSVGIMKGGEGAGFVPTKTEEGGERAKMVGE